MRRIEKNSGFTLVELLIAISILSVGLLGIAGLAGTSIKASGSSQNATQANNLAQDRMESLQTVSFNNLQSTDTTATRTDLRRTCAQTDATANRPVFTCTPTNTFKVGNTVYTWSYKVTLIDLDNNGTGTDGDGLKRLDVTVTWTDPLWKTQKSITVTSLRNG